MKNTTFSDLAREFKLNKSEVAAVIGANEISCCEEPGRVVVSHEELGRARELLGKLRCFRDKRKKKAGRVAVTANRERIPEIAIPA